MFGCVRRRRRLGLERLARGWGQGKGLCGSITGKLGKGDGEIGEDREEESLRNQKICGAFVVAEGEEEGDWGWSDWRLATGEGVGATATLCGSIAGKGRWGDKGGRR